MRRRETAAKRALAVSAKRVRSSQPVRLSSGDVAPPDNTARSMVGHVSVRLAAPVVRDLKTSCGTEQGSGPREARARRVARPGEPPATSKPMREPYQPPHGRVAHGDVPHHVKARRGRPTRSRSPLSASDPANPGSRPMDAWRAETCPTMRRRNTHADAGTEKRDLANHRRPRSRCVNPGSRPMDAARGAATSACARSPRSASGPASRSGHPVDAWRGEWRISA